MFKLQPLSDYVFISPRVVEKTASGIFLSSEGGQKQVDIGTVVAVGELVDAVKVRDLVLYSRYAGEDAFLREEPTETEVHYKVIHQEVISAILTPSSHEEVPPPIDPLDEQGSPPVPHVPAEERGAE